MKIPQKVDNTAKNVRRFPREIRVPGTEKCRSAADEAESKTAWVNQKITRPTSPSRSQPALSSSE